MVKKLLAVLGKLTPIGRMQYGYLGVGASGERSLLALMSGVVSLVCLLRIDGSSFCFRSVVFFWKANN